MKRLLLLLCLVMTRAGGSPVRAAEGTAPPEQPADRPTAPDLRQVREDAKRLYRDGKHAQACLEFAVLYVQLRDAEAALNLGNCHLRQKQYQEALNWYQRYRDLGGRIDVSGRMREARLGLHPPLLRRPLFWGLLIGGVVVGSIATTLALRPWDQVPGDLARDPWRF